MPATTTDQSRAGRIAVVTGEGADADVQGIPAAHARPLAGAGSSTWPRQQSPSPARYPSHTALARWESQADEPAAPAAGQIRPARRPRHQRPFRRRCGGKDYRAGPCLVQSAADVASNAKTAPFTVANNHAGWSLPPVTFCRNSTVTSNSLSSPAGTVIWSGRTFMAANPIQHAATTATTAAARPAGTARPKQTPGWPVHSCRLASLDQSRSSESAQPRATPSAPVAPARPTDNRKPSVKPEAITRHLRLPCRSVFIGRLYLIERPLHVPRLLRLALSAGPPDRTRVGIRRLCRTIDRYLAAGPGGQASRRISATAVTASRMAARTTKRLVSMPWNGQNRLAGW